MRWCVETAAKRAPGFERKYCSCWSQAKLATELTCLQCHAVSPTHLLFYGEAPAWFCSRACEDAYVQHEVPRQLELMLDRDYTEDEESP